MTVEATQTSSSSWLDKEEVRDYIFGLVERGFTNAAIAQYVTSVYGQTSEKSIRRFKKRNGIASDPQTASTYPSTTVSGDTASVVSEPTAQLDLSDAEALIRQNGLDPKEWEVAGLKVNSWESPIANSDGETITLQQCKLDLRKKFSVDSVFPTEATPRYSAVIPRATNDEEPTIFVVEGDHQVPYHDPDLHEASLKFLDDVGPDAVVFLGDTADFPTISKYADHPAAMANVNDSIQATYDLLRAKREACPNYTKMFKLKGNHDWRIESELLNRAERMYGIKPASVNGEEQIPALSLRRLLQLDSLDIALVEHQLGWEHAEVELVEGPEGLVVRHGWLTGNNTASRSLDRRGRSIIVGHNHTKEHVYKRDNGSNCLRQGVVAGTMSRNDDVFPQFAVLPDWHQGFVTVSVWPDGKFNIEHAVWQNGLLYWRDKRY